MDADLDDELQYLFEKAWVAGDPRRWVVQLRAHADRPGDHRAEALSHLAKLEDQAGRFDQAEALLREAIVTGDEAYVAPEATLGDLLLKRGRVEEGRRLLHAALETQPDATTFEYVGESLEAAGFVLEAVSVFDRGHGLTGTDHLLHGRFRTRRVLGMPRDELDEKSEQSRAALKAWNQARLDAFDEDAPMHLAIAFDEESWTVWGAAPLGRT